MERGEYEIETFSGEFVNVKNPDPTTLVLEDIAHALANTARYGGHSLRFFSVAEHAVLVSRRVEAVGGSHVELLAGLHHDDPEAYLGDIPRPIKPLLEPEYGKLTARMEKALQIALSIPLAMTSTVKDADVWALHVEARHLLPSRGKAWRTQPDARIVTPPYWTGGLTPDAAKMLYLARHNELMERDI
jgi:hypothetical protein